MIANTSSLKGNILSMFNDSLEKFLSGLKYLLAETGIILDIDGSFFYQYDDADDIDYKFTSDTVPVFQNGFDKAYQLGMSSGLYTRTYNGTREFLMHYDSNGLSYMFVMVHIQLTEYRKYYGDSFEMPDQNWLLVQDISFKTFIDNLIAAYLRAYRTPQKISAIDIINSAGNKYIFDLVCTKSQIQNVNIHNDINILSVLQYEKQNNIGTLIMAPSDICKYLDIRLFQSVSIQEYKRARKLFEIATQNTFLVGNSRTIYGAITRQGLVSSGYETLVQIKIYGPLSWEVFSYCPTTNTSVSLVQYKNSRYQIKSSHNTIDVFKTAVLSVCSNADMEALINIVQSACGQMHDTTIVFSIDAEEEAMRLGNSCFQIHPTSIEHITHQITAIDGAVLCDMSGTCYAIGIILDGLSSHTENISYGARHNSAKRYKATHPNWLFFF